MKLSPEITPELDNLILNLSKKLSNLEYVQEVLGSNAVNYKFSSVAVSYPALCIMFSELHSNFPEYKFDIHAHKYMGIVNEYLGQHNIHDISLFDGLCGVGFAAYCMSENGKHYQSFLNNLNDYIVEIADKNILSYRKLPLHEFYYDIMYGLTGTANYLLNFRSNNRVYNTLLRILQYLTDICKTGEEGIPKFVIRSDQSQLFSLASDPNIRYVNLGVSHGIPGILLVLLKAYELGICVLDQLEAIKYLTEDISNTCIKGNEIFWEAQKIIGINDDRAVLPRDAWCYGTPGVAYSLLMASKILDDNEIRNLSINSMKKSLSNLREVISPTFCHGLSGLCCLARKFYEYTNDSFFHEKYMKLLDYILDSYSDQHPFGFIDTEIENGRIVKKNEIGLLTGTCGVILTILSCYKPIKTQWDYDFTIPFIIP